MDAARAGRGSGRSPVMDEQEKMIEEVLRHLDHEMEIGALKMSVNFNELQEEEKLVEIGRAHV